MLKFDHCVSTQTSDRSYTITFSNISFIFSNISFILESLGKKSILVQYKKNLTISIFIYLTILKFLLTLVEKAHDIKISFNISRKVTFCSTIYFRTFSIFIKFIRNRDIK